MKSTKSIFIFFITFSCVFIQTEPARAIASPDTLTIEQLEKKLQGLEPLSQVRIYDSLTGHNVNNDPVFAIECANKSLAILEELKKERGIAHVLDNRAKAYKSIGEFDKALKDLDRAYRINEKLKDKVAQIGVLIDIGNMHYMKGSYETSVGYYLKAMKYAEDTKDLESQAMATNNIGNVYFGMSKFDKAVEFYERAYKTYKKLGNEKKAALTLDNIGLIYLNQEKYDIALLYQVNALAMVEKLDDKRLLAEVLMNIGITNNGLKRYDNAHRYFNRSVKIYNEMDSKPGLSICYINIGDTYRSEKKYKEAIAILEEGMKIAEEMGAKSNLKETARSLSEVYEDMGRNDKALEYYKVFTALKDSIFTLESANQVNELSAKYETEKKQKEIELLKKDKDLNDVKLKNQRTATLSLIAGIVLILLVLGLMIYRYKEKQKANVVLEEKNTAINEQKELITEKNKEITDSINYARRIQDAMLPSHKILNEYFKENFVFYKPKDIISGDFYWATRKGDMVFIAAADCTGHGVPGALMSMIGISFLRQVINEMNITDPAQVLNRIHEMVLSALNEDVSVRGSKDGMDMALLMVDIGKRKAAFAGSVRPLYIMDKSGLRIIKGDRYSIGGIKTMEESFTTVNIDLSSSTSFYMFSDGFADQFSEHSGKKFMVKALQNLLSEITVLPMEEQHRKISQVFNDWKGKLEQTDDVLLMGLKV